MIAPIIPLWLIIPICIFLLVFVIIYSRRLKLVIRILIIILAFIINLRIQTPNGEVLVLKNNLDVIFVVDTSLSMDAIDYNGEKRLDVLKRDLLYIIDEIPGASYSVIAFDNISSIKVPLTRDSNSIKVSIKTLKTPDSLYAMGSTITIFKDDLKKILDSSVKKEGKKRIVFIITDGENTTEEKMVSLEDLKEYVDGGAVLGYGTKEGGLILVETYSGSGKYEYLKDKSSYPYVDARSMIDEDNLNKVAKELGIEYIHMSKQDNVKNKLRAINSMSSYDDEDKELAFQDTYFYLSPLLIILFCVELWIDRRMYR